MIIYAVDDEKLALEMLIESINEVTSNATIKGFRKPKELLAESIKVTPDIVFLDVEMPGMNGVDLAKELQALKKNINIIFVTGYSEYMSDAMNMFASGYIMKPVDAKQIEKQMLHLRYEISKEKEIKIKTFGNFAVYKNDNPVNFRYFKSKEMLAYLVDRNGAIISRKELAAVLMEEGNFTRNEQKKLSRWVQELEEDLQNAGIERIFVREKSGYCVNVEEFDCDLYEFLKGKKKLFQGEYMEEYSWGENFKSIHYY